MSFMSGTALTREVLWQTREASPWIDPTTSRVELLWQMPMERWGWHNHWPKMRLCLDTGVHTCFGELVMQPAPDRKYWLSFSTHLYRAGREKVDLTTVAFNGLALSPYEIQTMLKHWGSWDKVNTGGNWFQDPVRGISKKFAHTRHFDGVNAGFVYFIQDAVHGGKIKIGFSTNPARRVESIQSVNPNMMKVLGTLPGSERMERELHKRFKRLRRHGEWFAPEEELLTYIETLPTNTWWKPKPVKWTGP